MIDLVMVSLLEELLKAGLTAVGAKQNLINLSETVGKLIVDADASIASIIDHAKSAQAGTLTDAEAAAMKGNLNLLTQKVDAVLAGQIDSLVSQLQIR